MPEPDARTEKRRPDLNALIDTLILDELKKDSLRARLMAQMQWMSRKAKGAQQWYYTLRLTAIIGGLLIPALVNLNIPRKEHILLVLGLLIAISGAMEEFFRYGDRWRHYRQNIEALKTETWQFVQLIGAYPEEQFANHAAAYSKFASRVEDLLQREVGVYVTEVVVPKKAKEPGVEDGATSQQASSLQKQ